MARLPELKFLIFVIDALKIALKSKPKWLKKSLSSDDKKASLIIGGIDWIGTNILFSVANSANRAPSEA